MCNHGSIRLFRKLDFGGNFGFWVFWPFPFLFFFLFGLTRSKSEHKDLVGNKEGDCFMHPSGFNQVIVTISLLFSFDNSAHCLVQRKPLCIYFFSFLFFFYAFLQSLIGWLSSFAFSFLFFWSKFIIFIVICVSWKWFGAFPYSWTTC